MPSVQCSTRTEATLKKSYFPVQRVAEIMATRSAAISSSFFLIREVLKTKFEN